MLAIAWFSVGLASALIAQDGLSTTDWPQWRGPSRDCHVKLPDWPASIADEQLREQWRVELGPSYSGPIVVGDRVFTTETRDQSHEVVRAFARSTGEEIWRVEWPGAMSMPFFAKANGDWIRSTPACDGRRLFVACIRDVLVCLDVQTGDEIWRRDFTADFGIDVEAFGFVCSPLLDEVGVFVQCGGGILKLDKTNGTTLWRIADSASGMSAGAFSSPVLATLAGQLQLVVQTRQELTGIDPSTGERLWSVTIPAFRGMNILTPLVIDDRVFTCSYGGGAFLHAIHRDGDDWQVSQDWANKTEGYMSSPVLISDHIYLHLKNQRFACIDSATGAETWRSTPFGKYWSMAVNGNQILALDQCGELLLIDANPDELRIVDRRKLPSDDTWAHVAVAGNQVFVRELSSLLAFVWE